MITVRAQSSVTTTTCIQMRHYWWLPRFTFLPNQKTRIIFILFNFYEIPIEQYLLLSWLNPANNCVTRGEHYSAPLYGFLFSFMTFFSVKLLQLRNCFIQFSPSTILWNVDIFPLWRKYSELNYHKLKWIIKECSKRRRLAPTKLISKSNDGNFLTHTPVGS